MAKKSKYDKKSKGNKYTSKRKGRSDDKDLDESPDTYKNDASWSIPNEMLRKQVGSFSFSNTIGVGLDEVVAYLKDDALQSKVEGEWIGNIMSIGLFPWIGDNPMAPSTAGNTKRPAIAQAGLRMYTQISAVNSKTTQYQPEDDTKAILMIGELVSLISFAQRAYGVAFKYNPRNRSIPVELLRAMAIQPDSLLENLAGFRLRLNYLLTEASSIRMLRDIKYFSKCWEIYSNIYYDKGSAMGQYYVTYPMGFFEYNEGLSPELGDLVWTELGPIDPDTEARTHADPTNPMSATDLLDAIEVIITRILDSSTFNYVFTDIVNYVTKSGGDLIGFEYLPEMYQVEPIFSEEFMNQVHNMTICDVDLSTYQIFDDPLVNGLYSTNIWSSNGTNDAGCIAKVFGMGSKYLDFPYTDNPDVDSIIEAMMYMVIGRRGSFHSADHKVTFDKVAAGDHPCGELYIQYWDTHSQKYASQRMYEANLATVIGPYHICPWQTFDIKPMLKYVTSDGAMALNSGEMNFWTRVKYEQLDKLFEYHFLGLFDIAIKETKPIS